MDTIITHSSLSPCGSPSKAKLLLEAAATNYEIGLVQWGKLNYVEEDGDVLKCCVIGSLSTARRNYKLCNLLDEQLAVDFLTKAYRQSDRIQIVGPTGWNDRHAKNVQEVIQLLREAAELAK